MDQVNNAMDADGAMTRGVAEPQAKKLNLDTFDASKLETNSFAITRRGFDPSEVRSQLQRAATEIRRLQRICVELTGRLDEFTKASTPKFDARQATEVLGAEVSAVLEAAHEAARNLVARAEKDVADVAKNAQTAAETLRAEAQVESEQVIETAQTQAEEIIERGREQGREMVNEAQIVRERMLRDLARKRQGGRTQVEQLRAGRDRLLEALTTVQRSLDTAIEDLVTAVPEARSAANRAGLRISSEAVPTAEDLEAEIEAARLVGHPVLATPEDSEAALPGPISDTFTTGEMEALDHLDALTPANANANAHAVVELEPVTEPETDAVLEPQPEPEQQPRNKTSDVDDAHNVFARLRSVSREQSTPTTTNQTSTPGEEMFGKKVFVNETARVLKKVLIDEQGDLLDHIRRNGNVDFANSIGQNNKYDAAVVELLTAQVASLGGPDDLDLTPALDHIHRIALKPMHNRLENLASSALSEEELSDAIRALYREIRSRNLNDAALAAAVAVEGLVQIAKARTQKNSDGNEPKLRWVLDPNGACGAECADNALATNVVAGEEFPTGDRFPPAHPRCTCSLELSH